MYHDLSISFLHFLSIIGLICFMVFNATFNSVSVISWQSVLWVEEAEYLEKASDLSQVTDGLCYIVLYRVHLTWAGFKFTTWVAKGTDCIGSYKSNYHTITTAPLIYYKTFISLYLKTKMQSDSNTMARCTWYNIVWWGLSVTCDRSVVFSGYYGFLHQQI